MRTDFSLGSIFLAVYCIGVWDTVNFDYEFMLYTRSLLHPTSVFIVDIFGPPGGLSSRPRRFP